jgi:hypothetical protein
MRNSGAGASGIGERNMIIYPAVRPGYEWDLLLNHLYDILTESPVFKSGDECLIMKFFIIDRHY